MSYSYKGITFLVLICLSQVAFNSEHKRFKEVEVGDNLDQTKQERYGQLRSLIKWSLFRKIVQWINPTIEYQRLLTSRDQHSKNLYEVVMRYGNCEIGAKKVVAWRLDSDTLFALWMRGHDDSQKLIVRSCNRSFSKKQGVLNFQSVINEYRDSAKEMRVLVLAVNDDLINCIPDESYFWKQQCAQLEVPYDLALYRMIAGSAYRDRDHFMLTLDKTGARWHAAIDDFREHRL